MSDTHHRPVPDVLQGAGYSEGDFLPVRSHQYTANESTTSSTYNIYASTGLVPMYVWQDEFPGEVQTQVLLHFRSNPSTDSMDVKLFNATDSEDVIEQTGIATSADLTMGPIDYTPTTTSNTTRYNVRFRNSDNATSVGLQRVNVIFGIKL